MQEEIREAVTLENQGEKIFGILHRPLLSQKVPAIVICPGFAGNKCGKFRIFVRLAQELARLGIAVLRFDYRGSGDSEGEFQDMTIEGKTADTIKSLDFLANHPLVDPARIGLLGRSLGGVIAILAARRYSGSTIKSLALWAPVFKSDPWRELWESFKSNRLDNKHEILAHLPPGIPNLKFLEQFFGIDLEHELEGLKHIPLLHIHGREDQIVKIEQAKNYEQARAGIEWTRFVQLPNSDHDFSNAVEQNIAIQETCQWYQQTL